jgi:hypothetical protein
MEQEYKGLIIEYVESRDVWSISFKDAPEDGDNELGEKRTLTEAKKFIDKYKKKAFKPVQIITRGRWNEDPYKTGTLTSILPSGEYRISLRDRSWEKVSEAPILDTPENRELVQAIKDRRKQIKTLEKNIAQIEKTFKRYKKPGGK